MRLHHSHISIACPFCPLCPFAYCPNAAVHTISLTTFIFAHSLCHELCAVRPYFSILSYLILPLGSSSYLWSHYLLSFVLSFFLLLSTQPWIAFHCFWTPAALPCIALFFFCLCYCFSAASHCILVFYCSLVFFWLIVTSSYAQPCYCSLEVYKGS